MQKSKFLNSQTPGPLNLGQSGHLRVLDQITFNKATYPGKFNAMHLLRTPMQEANFAGIKAQSNALWDQNGHIWNAHNGAFISFMSKSLSTIILLPYLAITTAVVVWAAICTLGIADKIAKRKRKEK